MEPLFKGSCGLCDMDGTLIDSEPLKDRAHRITVEGFGGILPIGFKRPLGFPLETSISHVLDQAALTVPVHEYRRVYLEIHRKLLRKDLQPVPGAVDLLRALRELHVRLGLVTSCSWPMMHESVTITGIWTYFDVLISADDVPRHKPASDPYLRAIDDMRLLTNSRVFAIEDTENGVIAAAAAGIPVIAISHRWNRHQDFSLAFRVLDSLKDTRAVLRTIRDALESEQSLLLW
ncbi:MAG: HAD family phosphatase [Patescibacteria group bacterium]